MPTSTSSPDVIIIGGGVIGLMAAWRLAQAGYGVTVFEKGKPGAEASSAALGILLAAPGADSSDEVVAAHARMSQASVARYPDIAAELLALTHVDVALRTEGVLHLALTDDDARMNQRIAREYQAGGLPVSLLSAEDVARLEPNLGPNIQGALHLQSAQQVDNVRLCAALTLAAREAGVIIQSGQQVNALLAEGRRVTGVQVGGQSHRTDWVVVAAGSWSGSIDGLSLPVRPAKGQAIALEAPFVINHSLESAYGYIAPRRDGRLVVGATVEEAGFDKRSTAQGILELLARAIQVIPALKEATFLQAWAGLRPRASDDLPVLGPSARAEGLIIATGHFQKGILLAPITAQLVVDWVSGQPPTVDVTPYSPDRFREPLLSIVSPKEVKR